MSLDAEKNCIIHNEFLGIHTFTCISVIYIIFKHCDSIAQLFLFPLMIDNVVLHAAWHAENIVETYNHKL